MTECISTYIMHMVKVNTYFAFCVKMTDVTYDIPFLEEVYAWYQGNSRACGSFDLNRVERSS